MALYQKDQAARSQNASKLADLILGNKYKTEQMDQQAGLDQANKLAELSKSSELDNEAIDANMRRATEFAESQGLRPGKFSVNASQSGYAVNPEATDPLKNFLRPLTPAQQAAEAAAGKNIADWVGSGGRPAMEKNLSALKSVSADLDPVTGNRDNYDRAVGAILGSSPTLLGMFGPAEKARRDRARSTAISMAKQSDPNPTEKQIETIMGQIYDPASDNVQNAERIARFEEEQQAKARQVENAVAGYNRTGYATIGNQPSAAQAPSGGMDPARKKRLEELRAKRGMQR